MHTPPLFADLLIILLVSVPVAFLCLRLKLPLLVGLMLTGIVIGPYGLGLIKELEAIEILAEIGVMLLLFTIGLEFSLRRLREMKRLVLIGGGLAGRADDCGDRGGRARFRARHESNRFFSVFWWRCRARRLF